MYKSELSYKNNRQTSLNGVKISLESKSSPTKTTLVDRGQTRGRPIVLAIQSAASTALQSTSTETTESVVPPEALCPAARCRRQPDRLGRTVGRTTCFQLARPTKTCCARAYLSSPELRRRERERAGKGSVDRTYSVWCPVSRDIL